MTIFPILLAVASQQADAQPAQPQPRVQAEEKKVCKTIKETGSRLGGKRECRTQAEWDRIAEENQKKARGNMGR